jgi:hypothetical protein
LALGYVVSSLHRAPHEFKRLSAPVLTVFYSVTTYYVVVASTIYNSICLAYALYFFYWLTAAKVLRSFPPAERHV